MYIHHHNSEVLTNRVKRRKLGLTLCIINHPYFYIESRRLQSVLCTVQQGNYITFCGESEMKNDMERDKWYWNGFYRSSLWRHELDRKTYKILSSHIKILLTRYFSTTWKLPSKLFYFLQINSIPPHTNISAVILFV